MKAYVIALAALTALTSASPARSQTQQIPKDWGVTFFASTKYRGASKTVAKSTAKVEAKWARARSAIIIGQWELCTGPNFTGQCRKLRSSIADLKAYGYPGEIKSIRPFGLRPRSSS
jgi:hypothetical protein